MAERGDPTIGDIKENNPEFPHGREFLSEAIRYLEARGIKPKWGLNYHLKPGIKEYEVFFNFLLQELDRLPFNNQVGKTYLMRKDAQEVVTKLKAYLSEKFRNVHDGSPWDKSDLKEIEDVFTPGGMEVFKNEIYSSHNIEGVGYNLDLSGTGSIDDDRKMKPGGFRLERRYVTTHDGLKVMDHGFFEIDFSTGSLDMDLEEFPTVRIHKG